MESMKFGPCHCVYVVVSMFACSYGIFVAFTSTVHTRHGSVLRVPRDHGGLSVKADEKE